MAYYRNQIDSVMAGHQVEDASFKMKITSSNGNETKWMDVTVAELKKIRGIMNRS